MPSTGEDHSEPCNAGADGESTVFRLVFAFYNQMWTAQLPPAPTK